jgi:hypothetical protein
MTPEHLLDMPGRKERGREPSDVIVNMIERFYLQHE